MVILVGTTKPKVESFFMSITQLVESEKTHTINIFLQQDIFGASKLNSHKQLLKMMNNVIAADSNAVYKSLKPQNFLSKTYNKPCYNFFIQSTAIK